VAGSTCGSSSATFNFGDRCNVWLHSSVTFWPGAALGEVFRSLFVAGQVLALLEACAQVESVAGAAHGEMLVSFFVAGAVLGKVPLSLFGGRRN